jgi:hypothetical protein
MHDILLIVTVQKGPDSSENLTKQISNIQVKRKPSIYASAKLNLVYPRSPMQSNIYIQLMHIASSAYSLEADRHRISAQQGTRGIETGQCKALAEGGRRRDLAAEAPGRGRDMDRGRRFASAVVGLGLVGRRAIVA